MRQTKKEDDEVRGRAATLTRARGELHVLLLQIRESFTATLAVTVLVAAGGTVKAARAVGVRVVALLGDVEIGRG